MGTRIFVDETKAKGYVVVAVASPDDVLHENRRVVRRLVLPGRRSIHMKLEGGRRRRLIADAVGRLAGLGVAATVIEVGGGGHEHDLRERALRELIHVVAENGGGSIVLDLDPTQERRDRQVLVEALRDSRDVPIAFNHSALSSEPLLTLPDVVAWCIARGGDWRRRVDPVLAGARKA